MSSITDFQECGFTDDRKKLDGFRLFNTQIPQDTQKSETNSAFNIRRSLAWDSAFFTSPGVLEPEELLQTMSCGVTGNAVNLLGHEEQILLPSETLEPKRTRKFDSCSFRKSLAWDNAFYTSSGVLDPEELYIVNRGFKKCESHQLPGIKEVWRSAESISTIDSGCSSLKSLEFELFEDKKSSMQKPTSLKSKRGRALQNVHSSKKTEALSRMRMKAMSTSQRQSFNVHRPERILKEVFISSQRQLTAGSGKFISTASLKPPKILSCINHSLTAATKRSSLGGNYVKMGTAKAAPGQCSTLSNKPCLGASSSVTRGSTPSPKSSLSGSSVAKHTTGESPMNSRRKVDNSPDNFAANGLTISTPLRFTKTHNDELESSCQHSCKMITPKSTSYASSANSLDGWSSESLSSSMSPRSISRQISFGSDASQASDMVHCVGHENQETSVPDQNIKSSGLRVPSPKIGFFDEEIALVRASGSIQFHSGAPNIVSQNGAPNRYGKLKPPRNLGGKKNVQKVLKRVNRDHTKENEEPNRQITSDRENTKYFKNGIEGLTNQVGGIDLGCNVVMELQGDKTVFHT
ncbi:hypothetical protein M0R45_037134 [Rubus argutus]|uniref:Uncharacterized protein n=1 Tax=Rubus argutus TaxID=59490 RepID=A0AAW1W1G9_RUBAR